MSSRGLGCARDRNKFPTALLWLPPLRVRTKEMAMNKKSLLRRMVISALCAGLAGCTVHPNGEREERNSALHSGQAYEKRFEARHVTPLPENPTSEQLVEYAMLNSADLEQRYWEWRSAIEQIPQDGT